MLPKQLRRSVGMSASVKLWRWGVEDGTESWRLGRAGCGWGGRTVALFDWRGPASAGLRCRPECPYLPLLLLRCLRARHFVCWMTSLSCSSQGSAAATPLCKTVRQGQSVELSRKLLRPEEYHP